METIFLDNLAQETALPTKGIFSNVLHKSGQANVTIFGFAPGQELSTHSAPTMAMLYFLEGEAEVQLGEELVKAHTGSFVLMPPMLPHAISAKTAVKMLLMQVKSATD